MVGILNYLPKSAEAIERIVDLYTQWAKTLLQNGSYESAVAICCECEDHYSAKGSIEECKIETYDLWAQSLEKQYETRQAIEVLRKLLATAPDFAGVKDRLSTQLVILGTQFEEASSVEDALQAFLEAFKLNQDEKARDGLHNCYSQLAELARFDDAPALAIERYEEALKYKPDDESIANKLEELRLDLADKQVREGSVEEALASYKAQLAIEPGNIRAKEAVLQVFKVNSKDTKEAKLFGYIDFYRSLAASKLDNFALQVLLAQAYTVIDKLPLAIVCLRRALSLGAGLEVVSQMAEDYAKIGKPDASIRLIEQIVGEEKAGADLIAKLIELYRQYYAEDYAERIEQLVAYLKELDAEHPLIISIEAEAKAKEEAEAKAKEEAEAKAKEEAKAKKEAEAKAKEEAKAKKEAEAKTKKETKAKGKGKKKKGKK